jgi:hypothetical protein
MKNDWHELTDLTAERHFVVTQVRLDSGISVEGEFELPPLARLRYEDQVFVSMFVRSHGSIKEMERAFGVSYPTVKNRLNRIAEQLKLVDIDVVSGSLAPGAPMPVVVPVPDAQTDEILDLLERGKISAVEAAERLKR